tara:strand:+ start:42 stop:338 length:297 start_codon:yes stop_codon:yes gene_type:complete
MKTIYDESEHAATNVLKTLMDSAYTDIEGLRRNFGQLIELFEKELYNGDYDATTDFEDGTPNLRIIQEDEYDQSMDEDEVAELEDRQLGYSGFYIFSA